MYIVVLSIMMWYSIISVIKGKQEVKGRGRENPLMYVIVRIYNLKRIKKIILLLSPYLITFLLNYSLPSFTILLIYYFIYFSLLYIILFIIFHFLLLLSYYY
jgi:hypothetical protein